MVDINKLKTLAGAATPSKWSASGSYIAPTREESGTTYVENWRSIALVNCDADRAFIAAANPAAVLELIDEVESLHEELQKTELRALKYIHRFDAATDLGRELRLALEEIEVLEDPAFAWKLAHDALEPFRAHAAARAAASAQEPKP